MNLDQILDNFNDKETASTFDAEDMNQHMIQAVLPYIVPLLFFLPLSADKEKKSAFCRFHANQQFAWFITVLVLSLIGNIIGIIPIIGGIVNAAINISELLIALCLMYGASQGKALKLPYISDLLNIF